MRMPLCGPARSAVLVAAPPALADPPARDRAIARPIADTLRRATVPVVIAAIFGSLPLRRGYPIPKATRHDNGKSSDRPIGHVCRPFFMTECHLHA